MKLQTVHSVFFIGIGGIGMSALARYFRFLGKNVAGYDKVETPLTNDLEVLGIAIHFDDDIANVPHDFKNPDDTLVVYTPAVPSLHSELQYFKTHGFKVVKRSEALGIITRDSFCLAVAGTHGKTTTSCILAHILNEVQTPMTAFLGGISEDFDSNFVYKGADYSVVEADEYDRSFLHLSPDIACITSMDADHLDIYGDGETLIESFKEFAGKLKPGGQLVICNGLEIKGLTYGIEDDSDYCIRNIRIDAGAYIFDIKTPTETIKEVRFQKPGRHNLLNGLAAYTMAVQAVPQPHRLAMALGSFKGVRRRFSYQINEENLVFIDDYAHHPKEIDAVYQAVTEMHPNHLVTVVFQPHLFSRTRDFAEGFADSLSRFDCILLLEIYPAREQPIAGITSSWLLDKIDNPNKKLIQKENLLEEVKNCKSNVLITMGAGDIGLEVPKLKKELAYAS
ncbi:MAG: UDP-N-acetylmuramate--L-alanine ligase [Allomuricauda sp.]|nr:MAG: UDP-N-acetylmuramate--L-alanine ligase [Allomuricauda sp.]